MITAGSRRAGQRVPTSARSMTANDYSPVEIIPAPSPAGERRGPTDL
jgi:hypothetical protein